MYRWDNVEDDIDREEPEAPAPKVSRASYCFKGHNEMWPEVTVYIQSNPRNIAQSIVNAFCNDPELDYRLGFNQCFSAEQFIRNNSDCAIVKSHIDHPFEKSEYRYDFDSAVELDDSISVSCIKEGEWQTETCTLLDFLIGNGFEDVAREIGGLQPTI